MSSAYKMMWNGYVMRVLTSWLCLILAEAVPLPLYFQVTISNSLFSWKFCCLFHMFMVWCWGAITCSLWVLQKFPLEENVTVLHGYYLDLSLATYCFEHFVLMCEEQWLISLSYKVSRQLLSSQGVGNGLNTRILWLLSADGPFEDVAELNVTIFRI